MTTKQGCVQSADKSFRQTNTQKQSPVPEVVPIKFVGIKGIRYAGKANVYNMEVAGCHNFAVNGGLVVHNCMDAMRYAMEDMSFFRPEEAQRIAAGARKRRVLSQYSGAGGVRPGDFIGGWGG